MIKYPIKDKNIAGIYIIKNLVNGKIYIGQSKDMRQRYNAHISLSKFINEDSQPIHKAINKYGKENFCFFPLVIQKNFSREELNSLEKDIIKQFKENGFILYNIAEGGLAGDLGKAVKEKIKKKLKNRVFTKEWREKISKSLKGRKIPRDQVEKAAKTLKTKTKLGCYKNRGPNNPNNNKVLKYPNKSKPAWNKGLTAETDERVAKYTNSLKLYNEKKKLI